MFKNTIKACILRVLFCLVCIPLCLEVTIALLLKSASAEAADQPYLASLVFGALALLGAFIFGRLICKEILAIVLLSGKDEDELQEQF